MRLTAVKMAGFKSFVDSTIFKAPTNLTGVVGPNGCGKSNIIDAVRWVMGEGSAKVLRGESMTDVIFAGSSSRKPVGTATVELIFDNADGKAGGEYAEYSEIAIKRQVSRDGVSTYFLNGTRCRRKDVRDLFLGTGAGTTGYSIIVQGMISEIVGSRPEDIRGHLEEAAGISKYKERRRETERRIGHTRDNLERLTDLREEVDKHLSRLQRQARAAERYKELKAEQRELELRLLALQWREEHARAEAGKAALAQRETALEEQKSKQRAAEAEQEKLHQAQAEAGEALNEVQGELYEVGGEIARLEQMIAHNRELQERQRKEFDEVEQSMKDLEQHMLLDKAQVSELTRRLAEQEPRLAEAEKEESEADAALTATEAEVGEWQDRFEAHHREFNELNRKADSLRANVEVRDQRMASASTRIESLAGQTAEADTAAIDGEIAQLEAAVEAATKAEAERQAELDTARQAQSADRETRQARESEENTLQRELMAAQGRLEALKALQAASEGSKESREWLQRHALDQAPRLLHRIKAKSGWEVALETVLGHWLEARVTDGSQAAGLAELENAALTLVDGETGKVKAVPGSLAEKAKSPDAVTRILNTVYAADSLDDALAQVSGGDDGRSAVTPQGEWVGPGWARVARGATGQAGMLAREKEISELQAKIDELAKRCEALGDEAAKLRQGLREREQAIGALQGKANEAHRERTQAESRLSGARQRRADLERAGQRIAEETEKLKAQLATDDAEVREARKALSEVVDAMATAESGRSELDERRKSLLEQRDAARQRANNARRNRHDLALSTSSSRASLDSLNQSLERMDNQVGQLQQRYVTLSESTAKAKDPEQEFRAEMEQLLARRAEVDKRLGAAREHLQALEEDYRERDGERQRAVQQHEELRSELERARLQQQEIELSARSYERQVAQLEADVAELAEGLPDDADLGHWQQELERLAERITRLEPVNLAAIGEFDEEQKRKQYLDSQHEDLTEALTTLENAIARIDRKTRTRFKDTFEAVNAGMKELFPRLFGGGHGYLELTGDDLLTTGVALMARPPGKRVANITLLSGGEKALTAVAFIFAIFRLNPAPFCLLDEVDAPLDDANVGRFCDIVREMSEHVQFIFVTHNKITMELANQLSGVTMREPGVSRLVQVDIDEAARMAEA
ncbi:chromosome segregation protein SMC [Marinihelvus fidelis]|uniref:Chromosome partition protein Smc n=1 Tax=Marinihelvus fidelis TaxID=2613842 RepID=A0A5N0TDP0_9GAMM|nr:chromosome segregation protein SMC [Marinihelvus fidelis]KAA9133090.1 chromosome segregation protein SMC [Marinihelvus fidelis]